MITDHPQPVPGPAVVMVQVLAVLQVLLLPGAAHPRHREDGGHIAKIGAGCLETSGKSKLSGLKERKELS